MDGRKLVATAGFMCGAALAFAPFSSADTGSDLASSVDSLLGAVPAADAADATSISSLVSYEVAAANAQFVFDSNLAGVPTADYAPGGQGFDVVIPADVASIQDSGSTYFDQLIYGVNPVQAGLSSGPGAYDLFNGAEVRFDDALNVATYALLNNGALDPNTGDFFGSLPAGFAGDTATQAFDAFYNAGIGDLSGYFQLPLTFLDITPSV